jgi:DNA-directed RNA polymerase subunit N (RpoN/RPB10)
LKTAATLFASDPGPLLRAVQNATNFDPLLFYAIDGDKRCAPDYQLASSFYSTFAAHERVIRKQIRLTLNLQIELYCCRRIVLGDEIQLLKPGSCGGCEPSKRQSAAFSRAAASQAARLIALCRFTSAWEFHSALGESAS